MSERRSSAPPGPSAPSIVQTWRWLRWGSWLRTLERCQRRYGDVFQVAMLGPRYRRDRGPWPLVRRTWVVYSAPDDIRQIFTLTGDVLRAGEALEPLDRFLGPRAVTVLDGAPHREERRELLTLFSVERLQRLERSMVEAAARAVGRWRAAIPVDLWTLIEETVEEVNLALALARRPEEAVQLRSLGHRARRLFAPRLLFRSMRPARFADGAAADVGRRALRELIVRRVDEIRVRSPLADPSLLDLLLEDHPSRTDADLDALVERLIGLGAGMENAIAAVGWTCLHLLRTPDALRRVCDELRAADADGVPGPDSYVDAACKEALRLHPPFPFVIRRVARPVTIGGFALAPDTFVVGSLYLLHRRPDVFPEPDVFRPERFLEAAVPPDAYLPFGAGARRCLGYAFAMREMRVVLAEIFRRFDLVLAGPASVRATRQTVTLVPARGAARVRICPRVGSAAGV